MNTEIESILQHIETHGAYSIRDHSAPLDTKINALKTFLRKHPDDEDAYSIYANYLGDARQYEEALNAFEELVKRSPENANYRNKLIQTYYHLDRLEECFGMCREKHYDDDTALAEMYYFKASVLIAWQNTDEAWTCIDKSIELDGEYSFSHFCRGYLFYLKNDLENAIKEYDLAIKHDPEQANAWFNKACIYSLQKNYDNALEHLWSAMEMDEQYIQVAETDEELEGLRQTEGYQKLIKRYK